MDSAEHRQTAGQDRTPTAAEILRAEFAKAKLDQVGGEPLEDSGFEKEQYELDFGPAGKGKRMPEDAMTVTATEPVSGDREKPKRDFRKEVTENMIDMLEKGVAPWQKPWEPGVFQLPVNPTAYAVRKNNGPVILTVTCTGGPAVVAIDSYGSSATAGSIPRPSRRSSPPSSTGSRSTRIRASRSATSGRWASRPIFRSRRTTGCGVRFARTSPIFLISSRAR